MELRRGNTKAAAPLFRACLVCAVRDGNRIFVALGLAGLGGVAAAEARPCRAGRLFGTADALLRTENFVFDLTDQQDWDRNVAMARSQLDEATWDAAWAEGAAMTEEQAVGFVMAGDDEV